MLLRRNLACFYCGRRSTQKRSSGLRQWQCSHCKAINYLDENGEITEPPVSETSIPQTRYARRADPVTSPELSQPVDSIFCSTCLKNQDLLARILADYLPDPSDPRYPEFERKLPAQRASLEARYPQVCQDCQPRVQERLRLTGYAAKTDHLRRIAEATKQRKRVGNANNGLALLCTLGAVFWWLAHLSQLLWHAVELRSLVSADELTSLYDEGFIDFWIRRLGPFNDHITHDSAPGIIGLVSFALTVCSLWWNPALLGGSLRQTRGLREFYKLQAILALVRFSVWHFLERTEFFTDLPLKRVVHATALVFNTFVLIVSLRTVTIAAFPQISFEGRHDIVEGAGKSLATRPGFSPSSNLFPIEALDAASNIQYAFSDHLTPPPEDFSDDDQQTIVTTTVDSDAMDLDTPEKPAGNWAPRLRQPSQPARQPQMQSPFRGRLPPAPVSQEHRLRNPPNKPSFQKASESQQRAFFEGMSISSGLDGKDATGGRSIAGSRDIQFARPQFFASSQEDTGLESMFSGLVSLNEESEEAPNQFQASRRAATAPRHDSTGLKLFIASIEITLAGAAAVAVTIAEGFSPYWSIYLRGGTLILAFVDSMFHLVDRLKPSRPVWLLSDLAFYASLLAVSGGLLLSGSAPCVELHVDDTSTQGIEMVLLWVFAVQKMLGVSQAGREAYRSIILSPKTESSRDSSNPFPPIPSREGVPDQVDSTEQISINQGMAGFGLGAANSGVESHLNKQSRRYEGFRAS